MYVNLIIITHTITNVMRYTISNSTDKYFNYKVIIRINLREGKGLESSGLMKLWKLFPGYYSHCMTHTHTYIYI